jgi:hypothetical protein
LYLWVACLTKVSYCHQPKILLLLPTVSRLLQILSAKLAFEGVGEDNIGLLIDDVTLTKSVPEPASLIVIFGLGGFGVTSLRKRKQEKVAVKA